MQGPWWARLELQGAPELRPNAPLMLDDARLFVKTRQSSTSYDYFVSRLNDPTYYFGKVYAIAGEYGSGKTTTVAYVRKQFDLQLCERIDVRHLDVNWDFQNIEDVQSIRSWFFGNISKQLIKVYNDAQKAKFDPKQVPDEEEIRKIFEELDFQKNYGFTIFLDELHRVREPENVLAVMDFLKSMQTFLTKLCRLHIVVFIACPLAWAKHFRDPMYGGIFTDTIEMPDWNADDAFSMISARLKDKAKDPTTFRNPLTRSVLRTIPRIKSIRLSPPKTPRDWLKHTMRIFQKFQRLPSNVTRISKELVVEFLSEIELKEVKELRIFAKEKHSPGFRLIDAILKNDLADPAELLNLVARIYNERELPKSWTQACKKLGIEQARMKVLGEILKQLDIIVEKPAEWKPAPVTVAGERFESKLAPTRIVYGLNEDLMELFIGIEDKKYLMPMQYLPKFAESEVIIAEEEERMAQIEETLNNINTLKNKLKISNAKGHISSAYDEYEDFKKGAFFPINKRRKSALLSAIRTIYNIVEAFAFESTDDERHIRDMDKDLHQLETILKPEGNLVQGAANLYGELKKIENEAKAVEEDFLEKAIEQAPKIVDQFITLFHRWISEKEETSGRKVILQQFVEINQRNLASNTIEKCLRSFRNNVFGILDYIDDTTFNFLDFIPKTCRIRLIVSRIQGSRSQIQKKAAKLGKSIELLTIKTIDVATSNMKSGGKMHHRWLACDGDTVMEKQSCRGFLVDFGTDLKSNSIANTQHKIQVFADPSEEQKKFEEYWNRTEDEWKAITGQSISSKIVYSNKVSE